MRFRYSFSILNNASEIGFRFMKSEWWRFIWFIHKSLHTWKIAFVNLMHFSLSLSLFNITFFLLSLSSGFPNKCTCLSTFITAMKIFFDIKLIFFNEIYSNWIKENNNNSIPIKMKLNKHSIIERKYFCENNYRC